MRFFARGEGNLFLSVPTTDALSPPAQAVYAFLQNEGASFATDIQSGTQLKPEALANALVELTLRGLATNDEMETLRNLGEHGAILRAGLPSEQPPKPLSALESELDARLGTRRFTQTRYREAKRRVAARMPRITPAQSSPWRGRWSLAHRAGILGAALSDEARAEQIARVLLERYGVVTREVLEQEAIAMPDAVYAAWQRMEWRGQLRRGVFVSGLTGVQYALPEAVEALRAGTRSDGLTLLNATDPANIFGGDASALKFARVPSTQLVLWNGQPVLLAQDNGERLTTMPDMSDTVRHRAVREFFARPHAPRHAVVTEWNGDAVLGSAGETVLKELGFSRMPKGMERWI